MTEMYKVRSLVRDYLRDMNYLGAEVTITGFNRTTGSQYSVAGEFEEFLGDKFLFDATYDETRNVLTRFQIVSKKPSRGS